MSLRLVGSPLSDTDRGAQKALALGYVQDAVRRIKSPRIWMEDLIFWQRENSPNWNRLRFVLSTQEFSHGVLIWLEDPGNGWRVSEFFLVTLTEALNDNLLMGLLYEMVSAARHRLPPTANF